MKGKFNIFIFFNSLILFIIIFLLTRSLISLIIFVPTIIFMFLKGDKENV